MRAPSLVLFGVFGVIAVVAGQTPTDPKLLAELKQLFPSATSFSPKGGAPPHFTALINGAGAPVVAGYAFWTTELEPLERGYHGPIKMLVGLDLKGVLAGVVVVENHEPYGNFSVEPPQFAAQFRGKDIRDPFKVGKDVDAVSRASITIESATRAIRNSARRVARELLSPDLQK
jgi:NosR/NirI family transcriptional regulator, nitrous oxide reductase regulator